MVRASAIVTVMDRVQISALGIAYRRASLAAAFLAPSVRRVKSVLMIQLMIVSPAMVLQIVQASVRLAVHRSNVDPHRGP